MNVVENGGVFSGHAKSVPPHGMQNIEAFGALVPCDHVAHRVIAHMPHVDAPGRVREHLEHIIFRARVVVAGRKAGALIPHLLPLRLSIACAVSVLSHGTVGTHVVRDLGSKNRIHGRGESAAMSLISPLGSIVWTNAEAKL